MNNSLLVTDNGPEIVETREEFAGEGDTLINVSHSSLNYKDAMALSGNRGILREIPMVPGIDAVGTLEDGTLVTVNGRGLGERRNGGYTPQVRIDDTHITRVPSRFTAEDAAAIGTAGYTAALSVAAFERASYEVDGPVLVTGATGGVGSIAVSLLAERGFEVWALTGRVDEHGDWLRELGASDVLDRAEFTGEGKPLQKARLGGVVDTVGSEVLANAIAQLCWGGAATACGMAAGTDLPASVLPFILRGTQLIGVNSVDTPNNLRDEAWALLDESLNTNAIRTEEVGLDGVAEAGRKVLDGRGVGRVVVKL
ncbi:acryloyl-CoA reductase [Corynebacterium lujinxingii]|uniref:Acryloyl-CoA reductase n=1 Tax=Corynebacterium lujinxingii TaxID=2763010 RepID=A0A7H0JYR3_9CORY|nr:acryloyl-CoA reductase [Corynebacterium lujinxingii]MBC3179735.1 acryloyl-CoA reductase [Corynebacterium lujinxingii]NNO11663.1 acryloyl-CoA reductase [Corynebacterium lujinxingii]QNP90179.1 acryloyl-CoA reductase [Corynebacterium lujinxingii]